MDKIILLGGGGHCKSCIEIIEQTKKFKILGIIEKKIKQKKSILGYKLLGVDSDLNKFKSKTQYAFITVGQILNSDNRVKIYNKLIKLNFKLPVIISPNTMISKRSIINKGTIIMNQVHIGPDTFIGKNCIINNKALIEHDCKINDYCHISTGSILNGSVTIGKGVFIGSGAIIKNNVTIGNNTVIGAGVYIKKNVGDNKLIQ